MKLDRICFEQLFPTGVFANQRLRAEATIDEGDNITDCYKRLQQEVENAFVKLNPQINWVEQPQPAQVPEQKVDSKEQQILNFKEAIITCTTLKALGMFEKLVKRENNPILTEAYDLKVRQLSTAAGESYETKITFTGGEDEDKQS